jgi:radical SAM superfamily enzyme YgiQ (UPF0313 family)
MRSSKGTPSDAVLFTPVLSELGYASLGYHSAFKGLMPCEHAFRDGFSVETRRGLCEFEVIYVSIAWELEVLDMARTFERHRIELQSKRRTHGPFVVAGGPLTLSNPRLLGRVADAIFVGEADTKFQEIQSARREAKDKETWLERLAKIEGMWVPCVHKEVPKPCVAPKDALPTASFIPHEKNMFSNAFLVEVSRGCPKACTFCICRSSNRKTIFVPKEKVLACVPLDRKKVGLLGASVSLHPHLPEILEGFIARNQKITLSSLRADRIDVEIAKLLRKAGLVTATLGIDGLSERLRCRIRKDLTKEQVIMAARILKDTGFKGVKVYAMVGLPEETEDDIIEGATLLREIAKFLPLTVSVSPFVPKPRTPLSDARFVGIKEAKQRLSVLERAVRGHARIQTTSPKTAMLEWRLAHADEDESQSLLQAFIEGKSLI